MNSNHREDSSRSRRYRSRSRSGSPKGHRRRSRSRSASPVNANNRNRNNMQSRTYNDYKSPNRSKRAQSPDTRHNQGPQRSGGDEDRGRTTTKDSLPPTESTEEDKRDEDEDNGADAQMEMMKQMMGFGTFGTTKNKKVAGTDVSGVSKNKKSGYRQYMNRQGGFNRALSPPPSKKKGG